MPCRRKRLKDHHICFRFSREVKAHFNQENYILHFNTFDTLIYTRESRLRPCQLIAMQISVLKVNAKQFFPNQNDIK